MNCAESAAGEGRYGGFLLGSMQMALPMSALREVVPLEELSPLPCRAPSVLGGANLRGAVVPVVDLRIVLDREQAALALPCIIVLAHDGRLLGLLAERVTGVFAVRAEEFRRLSVAAGSSAVAAGSVLRADSGTLVTVLSPALLAQLADVPLVDDPEPVRRSNEIRSGTAFDERSVPVMLLRCRRIALAIDAMAVHSTLANPQLGAATLAVEACRGTIEYTGQRIPAVDLLQLCGLGRLDTNGPLHAFVLQLSAGFVAFLVDEVIDVVRTRADDVVPLATYALPDPALFAGTLPAAAVTAVFTAPADRPDGAVSQYLLIATAALTANAVVTALAATNVPIGVPPHAGAGPRPSPRGAIGREPDSGGKPHDVAAGATADGAQAPATERALITFDLLGEAAAPMQQIVEILAYRPESAIFGGDGPLVGLVINRGRSIPLFCLRRLAAAESAPATAESRVLVVQCADECVGFVVQRVRAIEHSQWNPTLPAATSGAGQDAADLLAARALGMVGSGAARRMLRVLDLEQIALALRARGDAGLQSPAHMDETCGASQAPVSAEAARGR